MTTISSNDNVKVNLQGKTKIIANQADSIAERNLSDLADVDVTNVTDGSVLIYDVQEGKFIASLLLDKQSINGGNF